MNPRWDEGSMMWIVGPYRAECGCLVEDNEYTGSYYTERAARRSLVRGEVQPCFSCMLKRAREVVDEMKRAGKV